MDSLFFHPKLVHVPMALAILMPLIAGGLVLAWWRQWLPARGWVMAVLFQIVLVASGMMASRTGEAEEERVERVVDHDHIEEHEEAAELFVWVSGVVLGVMVLALVLARGRAGLPLAGAAVAGTLVVCFLGFRAGQAGGALVYRHGAANVYIEPAGNAPPPATPIPAP